MARCSPVVSLMRTLLDILVATLPVWEPPFRNHVYEPLWMLNPYIFMKQWCITLSWLYCTVAFILCHCFLLGSVSRFSRCWLSSLFRSPEVWKKIFAAHWKHSPLLHSLPVSDRRGTKGKIWFYLVLTLGIVWPLLFNLISSCLQIHWADEHKVPHIDC